MANPLAILGQIGAGLSTVGAGGARGALSGALEGEQLARKFQSEDELNKLRVLQGLLLQQDLGPQFKTDAHGRIYMNVPGQPPKFIDFMPTPPPTGKDVAAEESYRSNTALRQKQLEQLGQPHPAKSMGEAYVKAFNAGDEKGMERILKGERVWEEAHKPPPGPKELSFDALMARSTDLKLSAEERLQAKAAADAIQKAHIERSQQSRPTPERKPLGAGAAHWADEQGRPASPLDTIEEAVKKGMRPFQGKVPPEVASRITIGAVDQILAMIPTLKDKGLLMSGPGMLPYLSTKFQRDVWQRGDDDLTAFVSHTSTLVRTARELGDIGFRAKQAIEGTLNLVEKANTAGGVEKSLLQLRNLLELSAPTTVARTLRVFNTKTKTYQRVTFEPGETLDQLPPDLDPNR